MPRIYFAVWCALSAGGAVVSSGAATVAGAAESPYGLVVQEAKRVHAVLTFTVDAPQLEATEWILFVGRPPPLPSQREVRTSVEPEGTPYTEVGGFGRQVVRIRVPVSGGSAEKRISAAAEFDALLLSRHLVERKLGGTYANVSSLPRAEREAALRKTPMFDYSAKPFTTWLDEHKLRRTPRESDVDLARRAFLAVVDSCSYEYKSEMDRRASTVCTTGETDCGGMAVLFASAMRANNVPARVLVGCWAESAKQTDVLGGVRYYQTHVKGEFFAEGVGWVPVDPSSAVLHDKSPEQLRFFGHDSGNFLTMHVDPELKVDSIHFGVKTLPWLQQFNFFVRGKGSLKDLKRTMDWQVDER